MSETSRLAHADDTPLIAERRAKLAATRSRDVAFPNEFKPIHHADEFVLQYEPRSGEELEALGCRRLRQSEPHADGSTPSNTWAIGTTHATLGAIIS